MADGAVDEEVIVVGRLRPQNPGVFINYGNGRYGYRSTERNIGQTGEPEEIQSGEVIVTGLPTNPDNRALVREAVENVARTVAFLAPLIEALSDDKEYTLASGEKVTGQEIKRIWSLIRFFVTDQPFGQNRSGSVQSIGGQIVDSLYAANFAGPGSYADPSYQNNAGMNFIIMHEVMHMTVAAYLNLDFSHSNFQELVANPTDARWYANVGGWFGRSERFVNTLSYVFGKQAGFTPFINPNFGYLSGN